MFLEQRHNIQLDVSLRLSGTESGSSWCTWSWITSSSGVFFFKKFCLSTATIYFPQSEAIRFTHQQRQEPISIVAVGWTLFCSALCLFDASGAGDQGPVRATHVIGVTSILSVSTLSAVLTVRGRTGRRDPPSVLRFSHLPRQQQQAVEVTSD